MSAATHHGPWCDEGHIEQACPACQSWEIDPDLPVVERHVSSQDIGYWLLARLAVHDHYNRRLRIGRQEPITGLDLSLADRVEVARLTLAIATAPTGGKMTEVR